jgi:hypothetical protein
MALTDVDEIELESHLLGAMPIVNHFLRRLGLDGALERAVVHHGPVYAMGEWAASYDADLLGLSEREVTALNNDRVGRMLTRLFDADRASLLTGVVLDMVRTFDIDCSQLHNDSTSITLSGVDYPEVTTRGNQPVPQPALGHNKDSRPDLLTELVNSSGSSVSAPTGRCRSPTAWSRVTPAMT